MANGRYYELRNVSKESLRARACFGLPAAGGQAATCKLRALLLFDHGVSSGCTLGREDVRCSSRVFAYPLCCGSNIQAHSKSSPWSSLHSTITHKKPNWPLDS